MKLCVTGGAGYIGSVVGQRLIDKGHEVTVVDNLSSGHRSAIPASARFVEGDIRDRAVLEDVFGVTYDAVLHFAAKSIVSESVSEPLAYYDNNVGGSIRLLDAMRAAGARRLVFSSSAAVYGDPEQLPIDETAPCRPTNPYGRTKLVVEGILETCRSAWDLDYVALRYFNAGGSTDRHGEHHDPESHLIPIVLDVASGKRAKFTIFGDDYETKDGTCVRDYIHVSDLAEAHVLALDAMSAGFSGSLNLGSADPFTVLEVVQTVAKVTGAPVPYEIGARRSGDPPALLASSGRAEETLGWQKSCSTLEEIVRSSFEWRRNHPDGYPD